MIAVDPANPRGLVWIASYPKSGNTWVRVFLHHLVRLIAGKPIEENDLDALGRTSTSEAGRLDLYERFLGKPIASASLAEIAPVRLRVQAAIAEEAGRVKPTKTHNLLGTFLGSPLINLGVSAGAIYIVRNPLDVAVSLAAHFGSTIDAAIDVMGTSLRTAAARLRPAITGPIGAAIAERDLKLNAAFAPEVWGSWSEHVASWTENSPPVIEVVRYEDMFAEPLTAFTAIADHMRLDASAAEIAEAVDLASFARLKAQEQRGGFVERPANVAQFFRVGRAGGWREQLSPAQVDRIVSAHGEQMRRFGYLPLD